jgi:hypothetical protein
MEHVAAEIDAARNTTSTASRPPPPVAVPRAELPPPPGVELANPIHVIVLADDKAPAVAGEVAVASAAEGEGSGPPVEDDEQALVMKVVGPLAAGGPALGNLAVAGFAQPAFGQPALPVAVNNQVFADGAIARGMITHPHAAEVVANEPIPVVDMDSAAAALRGRVAFTRHRNETLGPVPTGCCKLNTESWKCSL